MLSDAVDRGKRLLRDRLTFGITPEQEDAFRKDGLRTDIKLARIGILLIFVPSWSTSLTITSSSERLQSSLAWWPCAAAWRSAA